jgi:peptidoglycan/xylan/chitin deacetylase (PgdA/CDA1 family)
MIGSLQYRLEAAVSQWGDLVVSPLVRPSDSGVVLLVFHSITPTPRFKIDATPEHLENTIEAIRDSGRSIISLTEAVDRLRQNRIDGGYVVLTFDDGYKDFRERAMPVLRRLESPATVSILPRYVGTQEPFDFETGSGRRSMSWKELRRLLENDGDQVTIANHSYRHSNFSQLSVEEARHDIERSQQAIEDHLGFAARYFTYPFGLPGSASQRLVRERFDAVLAGAWGVNRLAEDIGNLYRVPVLAYDRRRSLQLKAAGAPTAYRALRAFGKGLLGRN